MLRVSLRAFLLACLVLAALSATADAADREASGFGIGDVPPPLRPMAWIKGEPLDGFRPGHVYVVNFFATWCGASRQSMTLMSRVARRHAGDLTVIGVDVREAERAEPTVEAVSRFVADRADAFDYTVAMDDPGTMALFRSWMRGADMYAIPTAFIIGRDGRVAWIGISIDESTDYPFDRALADALAGTPDREMASAAHAELVGQIAAYLESREVMAEVSAAQSRGDHAGTLAAIDAVVARRPDFLPRTRHAKLGALLHVDEARALDFAHDEITHAQEGVAEGSAAFAAGMGRMIAAHPDLSPRARARAMAYLTAGLAAQPAGYEALLNWLSVARLEHAAGHLARAVEAQAKVVELGRTAAEVPPESQAAFERTLARYREEAER